VSETAVIALASSVVASIVTIAINYILNERSKNKDRNREERYKKLDLYKIAYPEKVKAAVDIMGKAGVLFMDIRAHYIGAQDREEAGKLGRALDDLFWQAKSYEFLLGEEITNYVNAFRMICFQAFLNPQEFRTAKAFLEGDVWAHEASYKLLTNAMRQAVHFDTLDVLLSR
jgi:hypothetical protein